MNADEAAAAPISFTGLRVLLVDDTRDALETFGYLLENMGCRVTGAAGANEAMALAERQEFDLLISDVGMPLIDGYELMRRLRGQSRTAHLPAIALTGYGRTEDVETALAAGFGAHVDKPVDVERMKEVIAAVMTSARTARTAA